MTRWHPEGIPRAQILALHGFNDYRLAFQRFGTWMAARGIAVIAYDQRGFGAAPHYGYWAGAAAYPEDAARLARLVKAEAPDRPLFLLGHSMGGAVAVLAAHRDSAADGLLLVAPALWRRDDLGLVPRLALWLAKTVAPGHSFTGESLGIQPSDNMAILRAMSRDPFVLKGSRSDAIDGLVQMMTEASAATASLSIPCLVLFGEREEVLRPVAVATARQQLATAGCAERLYPEGYHLLLRDRQAARVYEDILDWMLTSGQMRDD